MDLNQVSDHELSSAIDDADHVLKLLCSGKKAWMMHIPVQNDDPDMVFGRLIREARKYMKQIEEVRQEEGGQE